MENNCLDCIPNAAKHFDDGKLPYQHLPMEGLKLAAQVNQFGAKKYGLDNWRGGMAWMRILGSCLRHIFAFIGGEDLDPESGLSHVGHFLFDGMMLAEYLKTHKELDDRPKNNV